MIYRKILPRFYNFFQDYKVIVKNYENMDIRLSINGIKGSILIINDEGSWVDEDLQLLVVVLIADTTAELIIESNYHLEG